ncbi:aromatic ring-hydroxylating dioxygenase subunit alpha [Castellaniella sp. GW247-6E4]|uniref:aromatic ring-hydroxylating dioxygenase subunit alpha n=1 Tax=Castellaniella sp. GW247-6E4 TaxID=3140380 RepID=UPI00331560EC
MFPKNAWYIACTSDEIAGEPLGRTLCGQRVALYRGHGGKVAAVEDFCPHRGAALSLGRVVDGNLMCGYHGLVMGCDGKVVSMPMQRVGGFPCIRSYPVAERHGFVWLWPGDARLADEGSIPALAWSDDPEWAFGGGLYHIQCDYRLMVDNLMDLTHEAYVHVGSIGQNEIDASPVKTRMEGETVVTSRIMESVIAPPFWQEAMRANGLDPEALVDRWQISRFTAPGQVLIDVGVALAGKGGFEAAPEHQASAVVVDFMTPETESSHWYFWGMARRFKPADVALTEAIREGQGRIFSQDLDVLEAQQRNLQTFPDRRLLALNIDAGGVQARRLIDRLVQAEKTMAATAGTPETAVA